MSVQYEGGKKRLTAASWYILTSFPPLKNVVKLYAAKEMAGGRGKDLVSISASGKINWNFRSGIHLEKLEKQSSTFVIY